MLKNCTRDVLKDILQIDLLESPHWLHKETGIPYTTIKGWLNGKTPKGDQNLAQLCNFLGISPSFALFGCEIASNPKWEPLGMVKLVTAYKRSDRSQLFLPFSETDSAG